MFSLLWHTNRNVSSIRRAGAVAFSALKSWRSRRSSVPSRPLLCIGHSHVACVALAAEAAAHPVHALNFWRMPGAIRQESGGPRFDIATERRLREHDGPVFSMVGGAAHVVLGFLVHPRRFDFVLPAEPELPLDQAAEVIPALAVQRILESQMGEALALMSLVRGLCRGRMFQVEPPPPCAAPERISADIPWDLYPDRCREVSPGSLRYKLWRLHSQILSDWCAGTGVDLLPVPAGTTDAEGFLREPYSGDGVHGNERYGALVLDQLRQLA